MSTDDCPLMTSVSPLPWCTVAIVDVSIGPKLVIKLAGISLQGRGWGLQVGEVRGVLCKFLKAALLLQIYR